MKMNKTEFDKVILENLISKHGKEKFGYETNNGRVYPLYYTKEEFEKFLTQAELPEYKGSELEARANDKGNVTPPKMASVASSSRFCYLALKDGAEAIGGTGDVVFEKECKIKGVGGTAPQLDAYVASENIFVEAKCHEMFDKKTTVMRESYQEYIAGKKEGIGFNVLVDLKVEKGYFNIPYDDFGFTKEFHSFDFKQFLCHLLGIACQRKPAKLVYLYFKPLNDIKQKDIDDVFEKLSAEIRMAFENRYIKAYCEENKIELQAVAEYSDVMVHLTDANRIYL
jgi:hypothetical protein